MKCFRLLLEHLAWIEHQFLSGIRDSRKAQSLWGMMRSVGGVRKSTDQSWLAKGFGLGLLCWGFKGVQEEILSEEASTLQIRSVAFPAVHNSIPVTDYLTKMGIKFLILPIVQTLLPVTFGYSLSSEAIIMRQLKRWKRLSLWDNWRDERGCDEGHWHAHTRGFPWGLPEVVGTIQQFYCSRRRLLWRGLEFHVCTINKSAPTKKSLETYLMILVYIK